jgi:hypothetical protein
MTLVNWSNLSGVIQTGVIDKPTSSHLPMKAGLTILLNIVQNPITPIPLIGTIAISQPYTIISQRNLHDPKFKQRSSAHPLALLACRKAQRGGSRL